MSVVFSLTPRLQEYDYPSGKTNFYFCPKLFLLPPEVSFSVPGVIFIILFRSIWTSNKDLSN